MESISTQEMINLVMQDVARRENVKLDEIPIVEGLFTIKEVDMASATVYNT